MKLRKKKSPLIQRAAEAILGVINEIQTMKPSELTAFIAQCDSRKATNCWWLEYRLASILKPEAVECLSVNLRTKTVATDGGCDASASEPE